MTSTANLIDSILADASDELQNAIRELLMLHPSDSIHSIDASELDRNERRALLKIRDLIADDDAAHLTELHLMLDLCPIHSHDIEICADDQLPECIQFR